MLTKEQLDSIGQFIKELAPDYDFMTLIAGKDAPQIIAVVSNIPRANQPLFAMAFAEGALRVRTGEFVAVEPKKSH